MTVSRGPLLSLGIEDWGTLERVLYALAGEPAAVETSMERVTEVALWMLKQVLGEVSLDFAVFNEPIAGSHAPVVSPAHYRRFALPHYRRLVERLRRANVAALIVQSYGQVEVLAPLWLEAGINTFWLYHAWQSDIDIQGLRRRCGNDLRLIGGMPANALLAGRAAIDEALQSTVAPLLEEGQYLPMLDDRVRFYVPYELYRYYRAGLEKPAGP
jgi:uroporphyrinogen-III decarboxylase